MILHRSKRPADSTIHGQYNGEIMRVIRPASGQLAGRTCIRVGPRTGKLLLQSGQYGGGWSVWHGPDSVLDEDSDPEGWDYESILSGDYRRVIKLIESVRDEMSEDQINALAEAEEDGKARKTVLAAIRGE